MRPAGSLAIGRDLGNMARPRRPWRGRLSQGNPLPTSPPPTDPHATADEPRPPAARRSADLPLNAFQRVLRHWEEAHPYNAAQVMEVRRETNVVAASAAWDRSLADLGLGRVEMGRGAYHYASPRRTTLKLLDASTPLAAHLSAELNRPFSDPTEPPFRPFLLPDPTAGTWHLGVVYQHWVADSVAVRRLLRRWLLHTFAPARLDPTASLHATDGYLALAGFAPGAETPGQTLLTLIRRHLRYRRVRKVKPVGSDDCRVAVLIGQADGVVNQLVAAAHATGVRANDLLLAAAARAADGRVPAQVRRNRPDLAVGSIVDLRPLVGGRLDDQFGLFLGFAETVCRPVDLASPVATVKAVARQSRMHRERGVWRSTLGWLVASLATRPFVPAKRVYGFVRKETPMSAGVSNVNLNRTWVAAESPGLIARYRRISPAGPLAPVVFSVTSLGDDLHLSLTYRTALFTADDAEALAKTFWAELKALTGTGDAGNL